MITKILDLRYRNLSFYQAQAGQHECGKFYKYYVWTPWPLVFTSLHHLLKVRKGTKRPILNSPNLKACINMFDIFGMAKKAPFIF